MFFVATATSSYNQTLWYLKRVSGAHLLAPVLVDSSMDDREFCRVIVSQDGKNWSGVRSGDVTVDGIDDSRQHMTEISAA
jgi:hypothetical protein